MTDQRAADEAVRMSDRLAREVCMAAVEWLASDGDDEAFDVFAAKVRKWKELVLDGE